MTYMTYEWRKLTEQEIEEELQKLIRYKKGTTIATTKKISNVQEESAWLVESETEINKFYKVTKNGTCECADRTLDKNVCEHMFAVAIKEEKEMKGKESKGEICK
jgi:hypothetical protein